MNRKDIIEFFETLTDEEREIILKAVHNAQTSEVSSVQKTGPVMKDAKVENFLLTLSGKKYRCPCGCNVFHKPDRNRPDIYRCNACEDTFATE